MKEESVVAVSVSIFDCGRVGHALGMMALQHVKMCLEAGKAGDEEKARTYRQSAVKYNQLAQQFFLYDRGWADAVEDLLGGEEDGG